ncbi:hypothetical protein SAMN05444392_102397 [Seinonella peptonophila]|uniref:Uncharacterized protein n=2 Tax=Seinonella peptonophila TaxID=112248 RepID=A0A1M4VJR3_9BACL|nr:hypothetical protein SAMN05444392_102397 [Seinonella peptonophila]
MDPNERIDELWEQAELTTKRSEKVRLLNELIQITDQHQLTVLGIGARIDLLAAARDRRSLVALAWIFSALDRDLNLYDEISEEGLELLYYWYYIIIVDVAVNYPEISKEKIWALLDDYLQRIKADGYQHEVLEHKIRMFLLTDLGELKKAKEAYYAWEKALSEQKKEERIDETYEWDLYTRARSQFEILDDIDQALEVGTLILDGHVTDGVVENSLPSLLIMPLWEKGYLNKAEEFYQRTRNYLIHESIYHDLSWQLGYLALTDQLEDAHHLFTEHVVKGFDPWEGPQDNPAARFDFYLHVRLFFHRLQAEGKKSILFQPPQAFPLQPKIKNEFDVDEIVHWLNQTLVDLATRFDQRNENRLYHEDLEKYANWIWQT